MLAVIIPYFQRESGILRKALRSAFALRGVQSVRIFVIDDQSPVPARLETDSLGSTPPFPVTILEQANGGPGAARNRGLAALPTDVRYVAFLDSDDEWSDDHLANAFEALDAGYGCYFANHYQLNQTVGAFERAGRIDPQTYPMIGGNPLLRAYQGDMFDQILTHNVIGTSTVVYDFQKFGDIRFHTDLRSAGEDYLFFMAIAQRGAKFAFSTKVEAIYGGGVNVYSGSGWGTEGHLRRVQNEIQYRKLTKQKFALSPAQTEIVDQQIKGLRLAFVRGMLHRLTHFKAVDPSILRSQAKVDPMTFLSLPLLTSKVAFERRAKSKP